MSDNYKQHSERKTQSGRRRKRKNGNSGGGDDAKDKNITRRDDSSFDNSTRRSSSSHSNRHNNRNNNTHHQKNPRWTQQNEKQESGQHRLQNHNHQEQHHNHLSSLPNQNFRPKHQKNKKTKPQSGPSIIDCTGSSANNNRKRPPPTVASVPPAFAASATAQTAAGGKQDGSQTQELWWELSSSDNQDHLGVPVEAERAVLPVLLKYKEKERGMIKDQASFRLNQILKCLAKNPNIRLDQALSLRRTHMKYLNPKMYMQNLRLGDLQDIQRSATIFETVIEEFLKTNSGIAGVMNEKEQKKRRKLPGGGSPLTPDFLLSTPILLNTYRRVHPSQPQRQEVEEGERNNFDQEISNRIIVETRFINWVEVKMFYGASTIPEGTNNAVGTVIPKMKKYVQYYGEGAVVFYQGFSSQLAADLRQIGVTPLSPQTVISPQMLQRVSDHQKTWCSDKEGRILP